MDSIIQNELFFQSAESELSSGQCVKIFVQGTSMQPIFQSLKDYVIVAPLKTSDATVTEDEATIRHQIMAEKTKSKNVSKGDNRYAVRRRDIVLFRYAQTGTIRLHRIVHIWGTLLLIRGDGCYGPYERATVSDVIGIVVEGTCFNGHHFIASSRCWLAFSKFWTATYSLRFLLMRIYHVLRKPFRHIKKT